MIDAIRASQLAAFQAIIAGRCPYGHGPLLPVGDRQVCPGCRGGRGRHYTAEVDLDNGDRCWSADGDEVVIPGEVDRG